MTLSAVTMTETDGALGVLPPGQGKLLAIIGPANSGPLNTPQTFGRVADVKATFEGGSLVEAAATAIDRYGRPVLLVRSGASVAGTVSAVDADAEGTSVATVHAGATPNDDYEIVVRFVKGGTRGTAGATYQISYDGGRNYGPETALGTDTDIEIPDAGGVTLDFAAGTFIAGDTYAVTTRAANFNSTELTAALDALAATTVRWGMVEIATPIDPSTFDTVDGKIVGMSNAGRDRYWIGTARLPNPGETPNAYRTALAGFAAKATNFGSVVAGAVKQTSSVSGRKYRRPLLHTVAALQASVSDEVNIADINLGSLPGISIRDINGNPDEHDEALYPGLDDMRFITARTWDGYEGVYVNQPNLFSASGSDFDIVPRRLVINAGKEALRVYLARRLNRPIVVSKKTGQILETEALEIEAGVKAILRATLLSKPKASAIDFVLSRVDNLLSTKTLTGTMRVIPLAYPRFINVDVGYQNPALLIQQAA